MSGVYSAPSFELPSLSILSIDLEEGRRLHALWPVRYLRRYIKQTQAVLSSGQLFLHRLSHWIVEAISIGYKSKVLALPGRGMTLSWVLFRGVSVEDIFVVASWASLHTFVQFY